MKGSSTCLTRASQQFGQLQTIVTAVETLLLFSSWIVTSTKRRSSSKVYRNETETEREATTAEGIEAVAESQSGEGTFGE